MTESDTIREILELINICKVLIRLQYSLSFSTPGERRARDGALNLLNLVAARVSTLLIDNNERYRGRRGVEGDPGGENRGTIEG